MNNGRPQALIAAGVGLALFAAWAAPRVLAAPSERAPVMAKTRLVMKLATDDIVPVQTRFEHSPPTIVIELPQGRVSGALPERSAIQRGGIREIRTIYASSKRPSDPRWIRGLHIELQGPYKYEVSAEPGRIVIDVEHPPEVAGEAIEVGLAAGEAGIINVVTRPISERFRAMQEAMAQAAPTAISAMIEPANPAQPLKLLAVQTSGRRATSGSAATGSDSPNRTPIKAERSGWWLWMIMGIWLSAAAGVLWLWRNPGGAGARKAGKLASRLPSGIRIVDQLVWRSFERSNYQLVQLEESARPPGILRIISKDGAKAALLCVGDGVFFEKATVEHFLEAMQKAQVPQGFLVAPGSFTVPAQRLAKERGISLIGREQLTELLSDGATSEYQATQLRQLTTQLDEMKETLNQYARQLDVIRRQRNEASWFLGEERAKSAKLESQLDELNQQLRHWQTQAEQWQQAADAAKRQWEESEWFLGESKAYATHLEEQLQALEERARGLEQTASQLQESCGQLEARVLEAERQRDEANWFLGESRTAQEAYRVQAEQVGAQLASVQGDLQDATRTLAETQRVLEAEQSQRRLLEEELTAIRVHGERRRANRLSRAGITVELQGPSGSTIFRGMPRDISRTGFGVETEQAMGQNETLQVRVAFPGIERALEGTGRIVWQRHDATGPRYLSGYEFAELSPDSLELLEEALASTG